MITLLMLIDVCSRVRLPHPSAGPSKTAVQMPAVIHAVASAAQAASFKSACRVSIITSAFIITNPTSGLDLCCDRRVRKVPT